MTDAQRKFAEEWFNNRLGALCPSCNTDARFEILDELMTPLILKGKSLVLCGPVVRWSRLLVLVVLT